MRTERPASLSFRAGSASKREGAAAILFIHGAGSSGAFWNDYLEAFPGRATLAPDLPGRGGSPGRPGRDIASRAEVLEHFLDELAPGPVIPVGFSMGGAIAIELLLRRPGDYPAAVLVSTGARLRVLPEILELIESDYQAYLDGAARLVASPATPPETIAPALADRASCPPEVALSDFRACNDFDRRAEIGNIEVPVLVLGGRDDVLTPPRFAEYLAENIPRARLELFSRAGHFLPVERRAETIAAMGRFFEELP